MKTIFLVLILCVFPAGVFAQAVTETTKIDEFGAIYCCDFGARMDNAAIYQRANPGSQVYLVFYNGRKHDGWRWNARLKRREPGLVNPVRSEFRGFVAGAMTRIVFQRLDREAFVIQDGGFRESLLVEVWIVPRGGEPPAPTATVDKKALDTERDVRPIFPISVMKLNL
jgi:hypothetical protein